MNYNALWTQRLSQLEKPDKRDKLSKPYEQALIQRVLSPETSRDEARSILQGYFPQPNDQYEKFLKEEKTLPPAQPYTPGFTLLPWHIPFEVQNWLSEALSNINGTNRGRPSSLVLIGPPGCGKTTFALTFGCPVLMTDRWGGGDELERPGMTHLVLKNVDLKDLSCKRALAGCQMELTIDGKNVNFGRPVIWVCTQDTSPLNDPSVGSYMRDPGSGTVIVDIKSKIYG